MRNISLALLLPAIILFASCTHEESVDSRLIAALIETEVFDVRGGIDTFLISKHKTVIHVGENCFPAGRAIRIEWKEIRTPGEWLLSGLSTNSGDDLLQTDGMFHIAATDQGNLINPAAALEISMRASGSADQFRQMQLFRGVVNSPSVINWEQPTPINIKPWSACLEAGRVLFVQNCRSCHLIDRHGTGPKLRGVREKDRWKDSIDDLIKFVQYPAKMIARDPYSRKLHSEFGSVMTSFPALDKEAILCILDYVDNATASMQAEDELTASQLIKRSTMTRQFDTSTTIPATPLDFAESDSSEFFADTSDGFYELEIFDNGWYNIDRYYKESKQPFKPVRVDITVNTEIKGSISMSVLLPEDNVLLPVMDASDNHFYLEENLPLQKKALLVATAVTDSTVWYGCTSFVTGNKVELKISLVQTSEDALRKMFGNRNYRGVSCP